MPDYFKGKGAQYNPYNRFLKHFVSEDDADGVDEPNQINKPETQVFFENPKRIISKNNSPDLKFVNSINPYQGCEHGCIYCFARTTHEYWGWGAGLDFESKIIVKKKVADTLRKELMHPKWEVSPIMLSGNTDCYQPLEKKYRLTRKIVEVLLEFKHPFSVLTKNVLILRDLDLYKELSKENLVHVYFSVTTLNEKLRRIMEPRTATVQNKLKAIETFAREGIPVGVMNAPIIPGLNHHEIPDVLKAVADSGAWTAGYTVLRLNGVISDLMKDWIEKNYPDRFNKIWNQVSSMHGGKVNDSDWKRRIVGDGKFSDIIHDLFQVSKKKYLTEKEMPAFNTSIFRRMGHYTMF